ncbi:MAG: L-threonylcarbamoyladenylate synthase [Leptolyngbyaceae cyanobacterium bins.349]|nr:L-threonylcarbamoyladenylate synthase [Leptolyngbyaceae cyanobacterium bins.349]
MATIYTVHPKDPQSRTIEQIVKLLRDGAVVLYPTDTIYAIGCDLNSKSGIQRVRQIKQLSNDKPLTFLCPSLSNIAHYAVVSDAAYRLLRHLIPGPYTFLLPATKLVPKLVMNPKRRTTGIRVPDHAVSQALLNALGNPIISTSAHVFDDGTPLNHKVSPHPTKVELFDCLDSMVDVIVDNGEEPGYQTSTILDMTDEEPVVVRRGLGWEAVEMWTERIP